MRPSSTPSQPARPSPRDRGRVLAPACLLAMVLWAVTAGLVHEALGRQGRTTLQTGVPRPDRFLTARACGVPVRIVSVNLADSRVVVSPVVAKRFPHAAESFGSMIARTRPTIAINGSYFSKRSLAPIGDIVIDGRLVHRGLMGTALALTYENEALIRRVERGHAEDWSGFRSVLACGPALVLNGFEDVRPVEEGFKDPHVMGSCPRVGVGLTLDRHLLLVCTGSSVTFSQWARVMRNLGCMQAMNLDAGASTGLYYRGKTILQPSRLLTNLLVVHVGDAKKPAVVARVPPLIPPLRPDLRKRLHRTLDELRRHFPNRH